MTNQTNTLSNVLGAIITQAAQLPDTGVAAKYQARIGTGNPNSRVMLIDTSGSMDEICQGTGRKRRIDILKEAISSIGWQDYQLVCFNFKVVPIQDVRDICEPCGGTALHRAIDYAASLYPSQTLVISDGEPEDEYAAIKSAEKLSGTISTLYVGDDSNREAIAFMSKLAKLGFGKPYVQSLDKGFQAISGTISQALLPPSY
ncbi:VWA domain-containing protein [Chamaesiphon sp.]|uniref:vWA domain-containing protein n=1 Tax=Chamaesiphon sp. TaxID=2814140 RepID=UPI0035936346